MTKDQIAKMAKKVTRAYLTDVMENGPTDIASFTDAVMPRSEDDKYTDLMRVDKAAIRLIKASIKKAVSHAR